MRWREGRGAVRGADGYESRGLPSAPAEPLPCAEASSCCHQRVSNHEITFHTLQLDTEHPRRAMSGPIASAVVLPEPDEALPPPASPPNTLKRRQSSVTEDSIKRARTNGDDAADERKPAAPTRRERGRERRLFGAVLGALSQNPTTAGQKRRSEIEKRQLAQRRLEDQEGEQRKAERLARRKAQRWKEQKHFERQAVCHCLRLPCVGLRLTLYQMRVRHQNMLHLAHFLCTKTEPRLYYKPWELSPEEQERIDDQTAEAREVIQRERDEYEEREEDEHRRERRATPDERTYGATAASPGRKNMDADPAQSRTGADEAMNGRGTHNQDQKMQDQHAEESTEHAVEPQHAEEPAMDTRTSEAEANADEPTKDADEEVVEAAEDTVIY